MGRRQAQSAALDALAGAVAQSKARQRPVRTGLGTRLVPPSSAQPYSDAQADADIEADIAASADLVQRHIALDAEPTEQQAYAFAQLLRAGVPQPDAIVYVLRDEAAITLALPRWMRSPLVVDALAALNGGKWPALDADARLDVALDKHYAELAHYLYTNDFANADAPTLRKIDTARIALESQRVGRMQANSPMAKFLNSLLTGQVAVVAQPARALAPGERPSTLGLADIEADVVEESE